MADADHPIVCSKCKKPGTAEQPECASCGSRVVRVCGSCGFKNSAAKKYCDVCGENFAQSKPKAPAPAKPVPEPPKPAPKPEAKAPPPPPKPAPKPEAKAPPPAVPAPKPAEPPKPTPKIELPKPPPPKAEPPPPAPAAPKPPLRLEAAEPTDKPAEPESQPAPLELKKREEPAAPPPEPAKEKKESKDEAMGRYIPKTIISRLPPRDGPKVERDDEAAITPPEKPSSPEKKPAPPERKPEPPDESWRAEQRPEKAKPAEVPPDKKERVKMNLASGNTPMPKQLPKPPEEKPKEPPDEPWRAERRPEKEKPAEAAPEKKERVKMRLEGTETPTPMPLPKPSEAKPKEPPRKEPAKAEKKPGELDPRLAKGYEPKKEEREKDREKPREKERPPRRDEPSFARTMVRERPKAVFSTALALFLLFTGAAVYVVKVKQRKSPSETLVKAAGDYLFALKQKDYAAAYGMLSTASRRAATPDAFKKLQDDSVWTFDDLRAEIVAQGWAVVRYKLLVSGQQYEEDWLVLQYEGGQWRRAYWWPLQDDIEAALGRGDAAGAARLAHDAQVIDPLDPVPVSYTCEAAYMGGDSAAAADACGKAIKMTDTLPSRVGNDGLFRMRYILADIDRNVLKRPADAVQKYGILLQYPKLDDDQRCDLALAKGEAELELAQSPAALEDFKTAQGSCRPAADQAYAARGVRILSGQAGPDAIAAVQAHRMPGDEQTVAEWRAKTRAELAKHLKTTVAALPSEQWAAEAKGGAVYSVTLTSGHDVILTAEADLFAGKLKVEMHVQ